MRRLIGIGAVIMALGLGTGAAQAQPPAAGELLSQLLETALKDAIGPLEIFGVGGVGTQRKEMIPVSEGICFLMRVTGDFNGNGEYAAIEKQGDVWTLLTKKSKRSERSADGSWGMGLRPCRLPPTSPRPNRGLARRRSSRGGLAPAAPGWDVRSPA